MIVCCALDADTQRALSENRVVLPRALASLVLFVVACDGPAAPGPRRLALTTPTAAPREHRLRERPELRRADGAVLVRGSWGRAPGAFGRVEEASRPGPMSLTVGAEGGIHVLDQVNRRVQRFDAGGRLLGVTGGIAETSEDLVLAGGAYRILVYVPGTPPRYRIDSIEPGGRRLARIDLPPELVLATRLIVAGDPVAPELWLELAQRETVLVARGDASVVGAGRESARILGRPAPGLGRILARREAGGRAVLIERVLPGRYTGRHLRLELPEPILALAASASAPDGTQALLLNLGTTEASVRRLALVMPAMGAPFTVELDGERACDVFRPLALGPDGALHVLESDESGVTVRRFAATGAAR